MSVKRFIPVGFCSNVACLLLGFLGTLFLSIQVKADEPAKKLPRVLILGDSISIGYTESVRKLLQGKAEVIRPNTNCQHTAFGLAHIKEWLGKEKWDVIHFNWGIWDTHMLDANNALVRDETKGELHIRHTPQKYRENLTELVDILEKSGAKLIWASTTPIMSRKDARFDDIKN
ncbi:MAG: SGNH/GDSL hydrolase family protein, partial [Planctomycetes bacterium]|nr:SGNH/GDSL hydrolase family protein [Planctomycetota bacterium]